MVDLASIGDESFSNEAIGVSGTMAGHIMVFNELKVISPLSKEWSRGFSFYDSSLGHK